MRVPGMLGISEFKQRFFVRDLRSADLLEDFLVSAVAAVLGIRLYLHLTGYPQVGGETLHIAHMLWGGLLMLVALVILLAFLTEAAKHAAAIVGGLGFGTFIDELGKFITKDNDYFFEPTIALIYIVFVLLFVCLRGIESLRPHSQQEYLINALEATKEAAAHFIDNRDRQRALDFLDRCDPDHPMVQLVRDMLERLEPSPRSRRSVSARLRLYLRRLYRTCVENRWFKRAVIAFFIFQSITSLAQVLGLVEWSVGLVFWIAAAGLLLVVTIGVRRFGITLLNVALYAGLVVVMVAFTWRSLAAVDLAVVPILEVGRLVFPVISGLLVIAGIVQYRRSRLAAYQMFQAAVLVSLCLTQVFAFYTDQFVALTGLAINILILITLRYMISQEQAVSSTERPQPVSAAL